VITQGKTESRLAYLLRVAAAFADKHASGTIDYDETTCDGYCLADELRGEIDGLIAMESELAEMTARACSLAAHLPPETLAGDVQNWRDEYLDTKRELAEAQGIVEMQKETMRQMREQYGLGPRKVMRELSRALKLAEDNGKLAHQTACELAEMRGQRETMMEALVWYRKLVSDCNKTDRMGDIARNMLAKDHGQKAEAALAAVKGSRTCVECKQPLESSWPYPDCPECLQRKMDAVKGGAQ
jgi:hypothetical protein